MLPVSVSEKEGSTQTSAGCGKMAAVMGVA